MTDSYLERMLSEREKIVLIERQHWLKLLRYILVELIITAAIVAVVLVIQLTTPGFPLISLGYVLVLFPLVSLVSKILGWASHKFVVTNRRVIEVWGVFSKNVTDSSLEKVNDVNMEQSVLGRMFDYGDISVITGSDVGVDTYEMIAHPLQFKRSMLNAKQNMVSEGMRQPSRDDIPALIEQLDRLRRSGAITDAEFQQKKQDLLRQL